MKSILIFHHDKHIGSAIKEMILGIRMEKLSQPIEIEVRPNFKLTETNSKKIPSLIIFDENMLKNNEIPNGFEVNDKKSVVILISRSEKITKPVIQKSNWKYDDIIASPIERNELSKLIVELFESKTTANEE